MKRRQFLVALGSAAAWPLITRAQPRPGKVPVIGIIDDAPIWDSFRQGLQDLGYVDGRNIRIEYRAANGEPAQLAQAARDLASIPVDIIVEFGSTGARAAQAATSTIPIVMISIGDPVRAGFVQSLARPGGNMTGNTILGPDLSPKRLQILREVIPSVSRVAFLWNPDNASNVVIRDELQVAAPSLGIKLFLVGARTVGELESGLRNVLGERPDAVLMTNDPFHQIHVQSVIDFLNQNRIPGMFQHRDNVAAGGLISYGANLQDLFRRGAGYVHKILQGTKPTDLPVEQPVKFELVVNLKTAKSIGLAIPESFLLRADEVIE